MVWYIVSSFKWSGPARCYLSGSIRGKFENYICDWLLSAVRRSRCLDLLARVTHHYRSRMRTAKYMELADAQAVRVPRGR